MKTTDTVFMSLKALLRNPTRTLLTMLGIIIGTYSSICISSPIVSVWHKKIGKK